jgi:hypothetical protein
MCGLYTHHSSRGSPRFQNPTSVAPLSSLYGHHFRFTQGCRSQWRCNDRFAGIHPQLLHPLVAYVADLPEQHLIACVAKNTSPVMTATLPEFGDPNPHPPRTGKAMLKQISDLASQADPWDIVTFQKLAKAAKLLGVHLPFWRDWKFTDPALFLNGKILHMCHKFFFDHVLQWCKEAAGKHTLDTRYKTQHKHIGIRHFTLGVSHVKQMTGREH